MKLSPKEFWKAVGDQGSAAAPEQAGAVTEQPVPSALSLEERLAVAQSQGLGPNLRRQLAFVGPNERVFEFQALGVRRYPQDSFDKSRASHARGPEEAIALCTEADGWIAHGIYLMPARLRPGVETRHVAPGRWYDIPKGSGTTDSDVDARLVLAVDFDVKRSSAISATDEEVQRSVRVAQSAWSYLAHHLGESSLAYLHSGNGRQIHVALDSIQVTEESKNALAGLLTGLAHLFNTPEVVVDEKLYDAKRILPACGTVKKKGAPGVDDRPHRRTAIVTPEAPTRVPLVKLVELAREIWEGSDAEGRAAIEKSFGVKPQAASVVSGINPRDDSPFAIANGVEPQSVAEWLGLYNTRGEVVCPGCGETSGVAVLNRGLKCHHNRCKDKGRNGFRTNIDLVAEVHRVSPKEAVLEIGDRFGLNLRRTYEPQSPTSAAPAAPEIAHQDPAATATAPLPATVPGQFAYPPSRFTKISTTEIFKPLPKINWIVESLHLVKGRPTLIAGYGFSGKTLIAQSLMLSIASGSAYPVWGKFKPERESVAWHLDYEQGSYATKRRYQRLSIGHKIPRDALGERLQVTIFPDVYLDSPDAVDAYARATEGVAVCALDALRGATPTMDENDSTIRRCLDNLSRISEKNGTAFLVLHHAGKSRDGENSDPRKIPRGSSAIFDACGCVFAVEGEKNEPKLVTQTKSPAEAEGASLSDFYVSIEDVEGVDDEGEQSPTTGLRVLHQDGSIAAPQVANARMDDLKREVLAAVKNSSGRLTSANTIIEVVRGKRTAIQAAVRELINTGQLIQPGGDRTPIFVADSPPTGTGSQRFPSNGEPVPGSPPFRGEPVAGGDAVPAGGGSPGTGRQNGSDRDRERAVTAEADSAALCEVDERRWKAVAAERGWSKSRYESARALAKSRLERARADGNSLWNVLARGEDPRAWATERGWPDDRIRAGMRFVPEVKGEPERKVVKPSESDREVAETGEPEREGGEDTVSEAVASEGERAGSEGPANEEDRQAESDADALSCVPRDERAEHTEDWPEDRRARAMEVLKAREPGIARDAKALQRESYRGTDVDAWAREKGWSETRIRAAKLRMVW